MGPSMDRKIEQWCSYNFAAGSFYTKKLCSRLFWQNLKFTEKIAKSLFVPPFGGVRGNVHWHGSSMARWKARGWLPISANWTFFAISHGWGAMSGYWSKLCCLKGGWVTLRLEHKFQGEAGRPPTTFGVRKLESLGYHVALFAWSYV